MTLIHGQVWPLKVQHSYKILVHCLFSQKWKQLLRFNRPSTNPKTATPLVSWHRVWSAFFMFEPAWWNCTCNERLSEDSLVCRVIDRYEQISGAVKRNEHNVRLEQFLDEILVISQTNMSPLNIPVLISIHQSLKWEEPRLFPSALRPFLLLGTKSIVCYSWFNRMCSFVTISIWMPSPHYTTCMECWKNGTIISKINRITIIVSPCPVPLHWNFSNRRPSPPCSPSIRSFMNYSSLKWVDCISTCTTILFVVLTVFLRIPLRVRRSRC